MCWRDDVPMHRWCSMCGQRYYGDLGHRFCSKRTAAPQPTPPADHSLDRWADDGGVPAGPALPTNADMDRIYDAVLRQFAERLSIQPDEVEVGPKKHPSFYRALMHSAWLAGATADVVAVPRTGPAADSLAGRIAAAVAEDEKPENGGCDISAGLFGPHLSALVRELSAGVAIPALSQQDRDDLRCGACVFRVEPYKDNPGSQRIAALMERLADGVPVPIPHPLPAQANDGGEHG